VIAGGRTGDRKIEAKDLSEDSENTTQQGADEAKKPTNNSELTDKHLLHLLRFLTVSPGKISCLRHGPI
jgi:hypothetical protein